MAKASPMIRSFNAGEFSALVEGRPDLERYPASMRKCFNAVAAPQGPAIGRSGTMFVVPACFQDTKSTLVPFVFNDDQAQMLEFARDRIRFLSETGLQVYAPLASVFDQLAPLKLTVVGLGAAVGQQVVLDGFAPSVGQNGAVVNITAKVGDLYTFDINIAAPGAVTPTVALVYNVPCVYTEAQRETLNYVHSVDVMYLLTDARPRKLSRYGAYDWRLENVTFIDGPFMPINDTATVLTPSGTGSAVPVMTADNAPAGYVAAGSGKRAAVASGGTFLGRTIDYALTASEYFHAFDDDVETYWAGDAIQKGTLQITLSAAATVDGYSIVLAKDNQDPNYLAADYAPSTWYFEGRNGAGSWTTLDQQENYVLYDNSKSVFFEIDVPTSYNQYRIRVIKLKRNGQIEPRIQSLTLRSIASSSFNLTASAVTGINKDAGFLATDVGRLIRLRGSDGAWRPVEITARVSATVVTVKLLGEPLPDKKPFKNWRLGYWSDTTGWPTCGDYFEDRLALGGSVDAPDVFALSMTGLYERFSQTDQFGVVLDESAVVARLKAKKLSRIQWMEEDEKGLLIGTGSGEFVLSSAKGEAEELTARSIKARNSTSRGSARVSPVKIDRQVLYVQRSGRTMREFAYSYEADGYKSPSMSQLSSHMGVKRFVELDYAAEPYSLVWVRREDGSMVCLTYNREENVVGWHEHNFSDQITESMAVMPQVDQLQDALWMETLRTVNGQEVRYIERLTRFWDFDMGIDDAHYVDCALRYVGAPTGQVNGLWHLEGCEVYGLYDGLPFGPKTIENGVLTLDVDNATNVLVGLGFEMLGETSRLENGAQDGTAFGKTKRMDHITIGVWGSYGGEIGTWNPNLVEDDEARPGMVVYNPVEYPNLRGDKIQDIELYTGELLPLTPEAGYEQRGSVFFRRPKNSPLPFNITYIAPQMNTQDR